MKLPVIFVATDADVLSDELFRGLRKLYLQKDGARRKDFTDGKMPADHCFPKRLSDTLLDAGLQCGGEFELTRNEFGKPEPV